MRCVKFSARAPTQWVSEIHRSKTINVQIRRWKVFYFCGDRLLTRFRLGAAITFPSEHVPSKRLPVPRHFQWISHKHARELAEHATLTANRFLSLSRSEC
jgi:hypothetical protein